MQTSKKVGMGSLVMIAFLLSTNALVAQRTDSLRSRENYRGRHEHMRMQARTEQGVMGIPNLTDDQKAKIKAQQVAFGKEALPLANQLAEKRAHLRTLQTAQTYDANAVNATIDDISKTESQLMKKRAANREAIRKLLTDEQRLAFDSRKALGREHGRGRVLRHRMGRWN